MREAKAPRQFVAKRVLDDVPVSKTCQDILDVLDRNGRLEIMVGSNKERHVELLERRGIIKATGAGWSAKHREATTIWERT